VKLRHFRNQIGYVSQEPALLNDSIAVNMRLGKPQATDDEIKNALKATNSWNFVKK
jgi:subfamily B ATP-binding cassette protein MsbA